MFLGNFNEYGNFYLSGDYRGLPVFITTYPYREGGRRDFKDKVNFDNQEQNIQNLNTQLSTYSVNQDSWEDYLKNIFSAKPY